jgi:prevent-host-death family protein
LKYTYILRPWCVAATLQDLTLPGPDARAGRHRRGPVVLGHPRRAPSRLWPRLAYVRVGASCTVGHVDVAVSEFRTNLRDWLARAQQGDEIVVTERGVPVARLLGIDATPLLDRLTAEGVIGRPTGPNRPAASGRPRPRPRRPVAPLVGEQRR